MSTVSQIGIKLTVDAQSVTTEVPKAAREFDAFGDRADAASARTTRSLADVNMSVRSIVAGAAGLHVVSAALSAITSAAMAMPRNAFDFSKNLEVSQIGMAGILGSMTAMGGHQTDYNTALAISRDMIGKLNDDALRTAASSQELTTVFQALLAPGLSAKMTLDEIRQLTVVGTNAVKSMGLDAGQVVQELRDLVAGGITQASSTLATALGLKDSDIAAAKASSEGLFSFLMARMKGFEASSAAFGDTLKGKLDQVKEGATRVAAEGMEPLVVATKQALTEVSALFTSIDAAGKVSLNQELVAGVREYATSAAAAMQTGTQWAATLWENRDAAYALGVAWASVKVGGVVADTWAAVAAQVQLAQASRLTAAQAAAEAAGNQAVAATAAQKLAAYMAELQAKVASAQADAAAQAAQLATLATTQEVIVAARADTVAKLAAGRATMAQAEAQIAAARAAGALSFALAMVREGTQALTVAQAQNAVLTTELATLGKQQAGVQAAITAATAAQTAATTAATAAAGGLAAAQSAASVAGRVMSGALGLLGGPVGALTTALMLGATAWSIWGDSAGKAEKRVSGDVQRSTADIVGDLNQQIAKLRERNALAAAGMPEVAKQNNESADRLAQLQGQINNLQAGKGLNGGAPLPEAARVGLLQTLLRQYGELTGSLQTLDAEQTKLNSGTGKLTLTLTGAEQAWRKVNDGAKTASAAQQEYDTKLAASRQAWAQYKDGLVASGASAATIKTRQAEQDQVEKALATERDKKIKELGAGAVTAQNHVMEAQLAAVAQGYKLLAAQTADGLDALDSLRQQDVISEGDFIAQRAALQLADLDAQAAMLAQKLAIEAKKKDSAKEQATLSGQLAELAQKRANLEAKASRDQEEAAARLLKALDDQAAAAQNAAQQAQDRVRTAQAETQEIGVTGAALGELRMARVAEAAAQLEAKARTLETIDLSGRTSAALREQAKAMRDLAAVTATNDARRAVADYTLAVRDSADAIEYEQGLAALSQRDRAIALEQYRIEIDLRKRLADIDAKTTTDPALRASLRSETVLSAERAKASAVAKVQMSEWQRSVEQYDDVFRKGFADMVAHGEGAWKSFTASLATTFKTTVADQLYKAFAQPLVVNVVGNVLGLMGMGGSGSAGGGAGGMLGTASNAYSAYNAVTGLGGLASTASIASGATYGTAAMSAQSIMLAGQEVGGTIGAAMIGGAESAASIMSVAFDPVTLGIGALLLLAASLDDSGTMHTGGLGSYSKAGGSATGSAVSSQGLRFGVDAKDYSTSSETAAAAMAKAVAGMLDSTAATFGKEAGYYAATAFADDSSKDGAWGALMVKLGDKLLVDWGDNPSAQGDANVPRVFADGEAGAKEYAAAVAADVKTIIDGMELPDWAQSIADNVVGAAPSMETLASAMQQIAAMPEQVLQGIGTSTQALGGIIMQGMQAGDPIGAGAAFANQITYGIEASLYNGFAEQITSIISTNLVTPIVTAMASGATITEAMSAASIGTMVAQVEAAGAALKAIVDNPALKDALAQVNTIISDAVASTVASVPKAPIAPPTYSPTTYVTATGGANNLSTAVKDLAKSFEDAKQALAETHRDLVIDLIRTQGDEAGARAMERTKYLSGFLDLTQAERDSLAVQYDANQVVRDQITELEKLNGLRDEEKQLRIDEATAFGDTAKALELLTAGMSDAEREQYLANKSLSENIAIQQRVNGLRDEEKQLRIDEAMAFGDTAKALELLTAGMSDAEREQYLANKSLSENIAIQQRVNGLKDEERSLNIDLLSAQGDVAGATALLTANMGEAERAQYLLNKGLQQQIAAINERAGIENQLLQLQGNTAELRARELAALDPTNRALQTRLNLLQDEKARADQQLGLQLQIAQLSGSTDAIRAHELSLLDGGLNQALQKHIWLLQDQKAASDAAVSGAYADLERSFAARRKSLEVSRSAAQSLVSEVQGVFDVLKSNVKDLYAQADSARFALAAQGQQFIDSALFAAASGGGLPDGSALTDAIDAVRKGFDGTPYAAQVNADYDRLVLAGKLADLQGISGDQLSQAEQQLAAVEAQLSALDAQTELAKNMLDELKGVNTNVMDVSDAMAAFTTAVSSAMAMKTATAATAAGALPGAAGAAGAATAAASIATTATTTGALPTATPVRDALYSSIDATGGFGNGYAPNATLQSLVPGLAGWITPGDTSSKMVTYATLMDYYPEDQREGAKQGLWTAAGLSGVPMFEGGGDHAGGLRIVGERGWELEASGPSRIWNQEQLGNALRSGSGAGNGTMERLLSEMVAELASVKAELRAIKGNTGESASNLKKVTIGNAFVMQPAPTF